MQFWPLVLVLTFHEDFEKIWRRSWSRNFERTVVQMSRSNVVQRLYELCKETFTPVEADNEFVPPPEAIQRLTSLLDTIKPIDLGLDENAIVEIEQYALRSSVSRPAKIQQHASSSSVSRPAKRRRVHSRSGATDRWTPPVTYVHTPPVTCFHIHQCRSFSMVIFCLPKSAVIPLHDHCGMTVLSKLLYGSMHVKAYDWLDPEDLNSNPQYPLPPGFRLAELKADTVLEAPCEASVLYPTTGGNIHSFTAVTSCAVLDILTPPYKDDPSYYRPYPFRRGLLNDEGENIRDVDCERYVLLEEVEKPENFILRPRLYGGPAINLI